MNRRRALVALGTAVLATPLSGLAQRSAGVKRIGVLTLEGVDSNLARRRQSWMHESLGRFGWDVGRNIAMEWIFAERKRENLPLFAHKLVRRNVDVIVAILNPAIHEAARATKTIPVVMYAYNGDPVKSGLISSLARPGGNVTGTLRWVDLVEQVSKQYEMLRLAAPAAIRVASLWEPWTVESEAHKVADAVRDRVKKTLGFVVTDFVVHDAEDIAPTLDRISEFKPDALFVANLPLIRAHYGVITAFAKRQRLISSSTGAQWVHEGGLMYYGPDVRHELDRMVSFVDRILRGANPGDLAVEQPAKFEFVFNARTARRIGYTLPQELQLRVDHVVE